MNCIACGNGKLAIINSRKHTRDVRVWRRRRCETCQLVFTTNELPEYSGAFTIITGKRKKDRAVFSKALLLRDLFLAGSHMKDQEALIWLAETCSAKAFRLSAVAEFTVPLKEYRAIVLETLEAYDKLLAANYEARLA